MKPATLKPIKEYSYLDSGYVELLDVHLTEADSALCARASFNKEEYEDDERNESLNRYLVREYHTSPLEMPSITVRIKMPIFVMRQHVRHRTAKLNEQSLRYVVHDGDFHIPYNIRKSAKNVKQGSSDNTIETNDELRERWTELHKAAYALYLESLELGAAREQARGLLGTSFYTVVVWQMDLSNLFKYMSLRSDAHAQKEIQDLSKIFELIIDEHFPGLYKAWVNYRRDAMSFSAKELEVLRAFKQVAGGLLCNPNFYDIADASTLSLIQEFDKGIREAATTGDNAMSESEFKQFKGKLEDIFGIAINGSQT